MPMESGNMWGSSDRRSVNQESDEQHYDFENFPDEEAKKAREWLRNRADPS